MLYSKILVAYDDSALAQKALNTALTMAEGDPKTELHVAYVIKVPPMVNIELENYKPFEAAVAELGKDTIDKIEKTLSKIPNPSKAYLLKGSSPATVLLAHGEKEGCDLIIMGSRGQSGIKEFLGSVSHGVVHHSKIPVLIVK